VTQRRNGGTQTSQHPNGERRNGGAQTAALKCLASQTLTHILDLVLTDVPLIEKIDYLAPLGKSDHSVLLIETSVLGSGEQKSPKYNLAKGDYNSFREHNVNGLGKFLSRL